MNANQMLESEIARGCECICNPAVRADHVAIRVAAAKALVAAGHWIVETQGRVETFDASAKVSNFHARRWMTAGAVATVRGLKSLPVGSVFELETGFHPKHGVKVQQFKRIA